MAKPSYARYSGVAVYANGYVMSRVQNASIDSDLGEEEAKELNNENVVEYTATNPQVSISVETNEYGSCRNLRAVAQVTGAVASINVNSFDGTSTDIALAVEEDSVLKRTAIVNDAFLSSISWNYDVGGVATESFSWESDNKTWYLNTARQSFSIMGITSTVSGMGMWEVKLPIPSSYLHTYSGYKQYVDGVLATGTPYLATGAAYEGSATGLLKSHFCDTNLTTGTRYRTVIYKRTPDTAIQQATSTSTIGSTPRGKLNLYLVSGAGETTPASTNFLRVQSVSIDVDLGREVLNELGHYRAYSRSLTYPVPVNVSFSTLSSDLEDWANLSTKTFAGVTGLGIDEFTKNAKLRVEIYSKQDTVTDGTRAFLKAITISGLQVVNESFGVDVGGNATQDFSCKATNFLVSGAGEPGYYPIDGGSTPTT